MPIINWHIISCSYLLSIKLWPHDPRPASVYGINIFSFFLVWPLFGFSREFLFGFTFHERFVWSPCVSLLVRQKWHGEFYIVFFQVQISTYIKDTHITCSSIVYTYVCLFVMYVHTIIFKYMYMYVHCLCISKSLFIYIYLLKINI